MFMSSKLYYKINKKISKNKKIKIKINKHIKKYYGQIMLD